MAQQLPTEPFEKDWVLIAVLVPLILFAIAISIERNPVGKLVSRVSRYLLPVTESTTGSPVTGWNDLFMTLSSASAMATFLCFVQIHHQADIWGLEGLVLWVFNLGVIFVVILARFIAIKITGYISGTSVLFDEYFNNIIQIYKLLSVLVLAANISIPYFVSIDDIWFIRAIFLVAGLLIVIRYIRLTRLFIRHRFYLFYLILYLCALEFTPVLILVKYLSGPVN